MSNARFGLRVRNGLVRGITEGIAGIDPDALAFINAANITDSTQYTAIVQLVLDLKTYGLWNKLSAIYPFIGGTASSHKFNLKDPRDLNVAFRLLFNGGITHNQNGVTFNGVNGYANTNLIPLSVLSQNNNSQTFYNRIVPNINSYNGCNNFALGSYNNGSVIEGASYETTSIQINTTFLGLISHIRRASGVANSVQVYKNGISVGNNSSVSNVASILNNYWIGALNNNGSIVFPSTYNIAFASLGESMTNTEASNFYTAVQNFQTTLGRQV